MKSLMLLGIVLLGIQGYLTAQAGEPKQAEPQFEFVELEGIDEPEIYQHFYDVLSAGVVEEESELLSISESGSERFLVLNTGDEIQVFLLVEDGDDGYAVGLHFVSSFVSIADGEETSLPTDVISFDVEALNRSMRIENIRQSLRNGESVASILAEQVKVQSDELRAASSGAAEQPVSVEVNCSAPSSDTFCCPFTKGSEIRIICVCNRGSGNWSICLDTGWL